MDEFSLKLKDIEKDLKDVINNKCIDYFKILDKYKDKSDFEIIIDLYVHKISEHCKEKNLEVKEFSIIKDEVGNYDIIIHFDEHGKA